ncbi:MAG: NAD(P)/FAD-dependent oxidoreductase [bacterium]
MDKAEITIIGAGIVGLAVAAELSKRHSDIIVLERNDNFGLETSSRNSEVIHAGIYYPPGSLKQTLCLEGARHLYKICKKESIPHKRLGKIIIATHHSELSDLEALFKRATENGVPKVKLLEQREICKLEPHTKAIAGIYSPWTGIIDSHSLMKYFVKKTKATGVEIAYRSEVNYLCKEREGFVVGLKQDEYRFLSEVVINCAGLFSDRIAALAGLDIDRLGYRLHYCKGDYFSYAKPSPVSMLVYPLPRKDGQSLGVHAALEMGSRLRFGPDAEYVNEIHYQIQADKAESFYQAAQRIIPNLEKSAFLPDMSGIRPKLQGPHDSFRDFVIREESEAGLPGLINLIGIESPGLTSCVAMAKKVSQMVSRALAS